MQAALGRWNSNLPGVEPPGVRSDCVLLLVNSQWLPASAAGLCSWIPSFSGSSFLLGPLCAYETSHLSGHISREWVGDHAFRNPGVTGTCSSQGWHFVGPCMLILFALYKKTLVKRLSR